jgi:hypothetical protein
MSYLNETERRVLREAYKASEGNGHDFGMAEDIDVERAGISRAQLGAYIGSLSTKGYLNPYTTMTAGLGERMYDGLFYLTAEGHNTGQELVGSDSFTIGDYRRLFPGS